MSAIQLAQPSGPLEISPIGSLSSGVDRERLRDELIALYHQYRIGADQAVTTQTHYEHLADTLRTVLEDILPGWDLGSASDGATELITLYHQYRGDMGHAAAIQEHFERLTHDIAVILDAEFPEWNEAAAYQNGE